MGHVNPTETLCSAFMEYIDGIFDPNDRGIETIIGRFGDELHKSIATKSLESKAASESIHEEVRTLLARHKQDGRKAIVEFVQSRYSVSDSRETRERSTSARPDNRNESTETQYIILTQRFGLVAESPPARGGMGIVREAQQVELAGRRVSLKHIRPEYVEKESYQRRFRREAQITAQLDHPSIVPIYGYGSLPDGQPIYAMRFLPLSHRNSISSPGKPVGTLSKLIQEFHSSDSTVKQSAYRSSRFLAYLEGFVAVCRAMAHAHRAGIVHRDLKPEHIWFGPSGETFILDWGLAKPMADANRIGGAGLSDCDDSGSGTSANAVLGTPGYLSPEHLPNHIHAPAARTDYGPRSDIYCLGIIFREMLTNQRLKQDTETDLRKGIKEGYTKPRDIQPNVPAALQSICLKAMKLATCDRYSTADEMAEDIRKWIAHEQLDQDVHREGVVEFGVRWVRRHPTFSGATIVASLLALPFLLYVLYANHRIGQQEQMVSAYFSKAIDAIDGFLVQMTEAPELKSVELLPFRRRQMAKAKAYYSELLAAPRTKTQAKVVSDELAKAHVGLARITFEQLLTQNALPKAYYQVERYLDKALTLCPIDDVITQSDAFQLRGRVYDQIYKRYEKASWQYTKAKCIREMLLAAKPDNNELRRRVASSYLTLGQLFDKQAQNLYDKTALKKNGMLVGRAKTYLFDETVLQRCCNKSTIALTNEIGQIEDDELLLALECAKWRVNRGITLKSEGILHRTAKEDDNSCEKLQAAERELELAVNDFEAIKKLSEPRLGHEAAIALADAQYELATVLVELRDSKIDRNSAELITAAKKNLWKARDVYRKYPTASTFLKDQAHVFDTLTDCFFEECGAYVYNARTAQLLRKKALGQETNLRRKRQLEDEIAAWDEDIRGRIDAILDKSGTAATSDVPEFARQIGRVSRAFCFLGEGMLARELPDVRQDLRQAREILLNHKRERPITPRDDLAIAAVCRELGFCELLRSDDRIGKSEGVKLLEVSLDQLREHERFSDYRALWCKEMFEAADCIYFLQALNSEQNEGEDTRAVTQLWRKFHHIWEAYTTAE